MEDIYIELLRYGREHLTDGVTLSETLSYLKKLQPESVLVQSEEDFARTFNDACPYIGASMESKRVLSMEHYFNLLEHDELREARQSSRNALWVAIGAIVISGVLSGVSVYLQVADRVSWI